MNRIPVSALAATLFMSIGITACLSGGGSGGGSSDAKDRIGINTGPITGFGSIFVNGVEFDTDTATVTINGIAADDTDLRPGMVVSARGKLSADRLTGIAESVEFNSDIEGPIESIDLPAGTLVVLGQTVTVDGLTVFDRATDPDMLTVGDIVEVSGLAGAGDVMVATRIELQPATAVFTTRGEVAAHDPRAQTFMLNNLLVDYSSASIINVPGGVPSIGLMVEVEGPLAGGVMQADRLEALEQESREAGEEPRIQGLVTRFVSPTNFDVSGQTVATSWTTGFEEGIPADLALNVRVVVTGTYDFFGVIVATKVVFKDESSGRSGSGDIRLRAAVDAVNVSAGTVTLLGSVVHTQADTLFRDERDETRSFGLADVVPGDYLSIVAYESFSSGNLIAERLERTETPPGGEARVEGQASMIDTDTETLDIAGVPVTTNGGTVYRDETGATISSADFFAAAGDGDKVSTLGTWTGFSVLATRLSLDD